jgi:UDP-galactopyranose mutase
MDLTNDHQLANTRAKLAELEARYEALRRDTGEDAQVREVTMRSLWKYINQFKEEIARYECLRNGQSQDRVTIPHEIQSEMELENTRRKLHRLEELLESKSIDAADDELRRAERISLKRLINQLNEEITRYEARQPAQG